MYGNAMQCNAGSDGVGELGDGRAGGSYSHPYPAVVPGGIKFISIAAGMHYTCGIAVSGFAYCFGEI